ncbi:MAG: ferrous iron transport protein A [Lachnospiraceae bacterium]|nr:ferrous iron transport protein A [Lachnospiraceae bacterium]
MKLSELQPGVCGRVTSVGGDAAFQRRITAVGLTQGSNVKVMRNEKHFPLLLFARNTVLAVNRKECEEIEIEVADK